MPDDITRVWCDGSHGHLTDTGGWAYVLAHGDLRKENYGGVQAPPWGSLGAELWAIRHALASIRHAAVVLVFTDCMTAKDLLRQPLRRKHKGTLIEETHAELRRVGATVHWRRRRSCPELCRVDTLSRKGLRQAADAQYRAFLESFA